jgi:hypothetical protein
VYLPSTCQNSTSGMGGRPMKSEDRIGSFYLAFDTNCKLGILHRTSGDAVDTLGSHYETGAPAFLPVIEFHTIPSELFGTGLV